MSTILSSLLNLYFRFVIVLFSSLHLKLTYLYAHFYYLVFLLSIAHVLYSEISTSILYIHNFFSLFYSHHQSIVTLLLVFLMTSNFFDDSIDCHNHLLSHEGIVATHSMLIFIMGHSFCY